MTAYISRLADFLKYPCVLFLVLLTIFLYPSISNSADGNNPGNSEQAEKDSPDQLWLKCQNLLEEGKLFPAAKKFNSFYNKFPDHPHAEEALWQSANLYKDIALNSEEPDWEKVGNLYREYSSVYKGTLKAEEAYLELAQAQIKMKLVREGLSYINIFMKTYPRSVLKPRALSMKADVLMAVGRQEEALEICQKFIENMDEGYKSFYPVIASIFLRLGYHEKAIRLVDETIPSIPSFSEELFRVMAVKGYALTRMKSLERVEEGRRILFYIANVSEDNLLKSQVFFGIAESLFQSGEKKSAEQLYKKVLTLVDNNEKAALFSRFRVAFLVDEQRRINDLQNKNVLDDPSGDRPYLDVLEYYDQDPMAQDARFGLMKRLIYRGENDVAYDLGRTYLQNGGVKYETEVVESLGGILAQKIEEHLNKGEEQAVYDLYRREHLVIRKYPEGKLLFLVGQALESMGLYDQASVVYYRAVALNHPEKQKSELYFRRANLYIKNKDYLSAERLLNYLVKIYKDRSEIGEVYYLLGNLRKDQGQVEEAVNAYAKAIKIDKTGERRSDYAAAFVRLLYEQKRLDEMSEVLERAADEKWIEGQELQNFYGQLGDTFFEKGDQGVALMAYRKAIVDGLPTEGERVQTIHIRLGDILSAQGQKDQGKKHYQLASKGKHERWSQVAFERLQHEKINDTVDSLGAILEY